MVENIYDALPRNLVRLVHHHLVVYYSRHVGTNPETNLYKKKHEEKIEKKKIYYILKDTQKINGKTKSFTLFMVYKQIRMARRKRKIHKGLWRFKWQKRR